RAARRFAVEHGIPARVHTPVGSPWDRAVAGQGGPRGVAPAAGPVSAVLGAPPDGAADPRVELSERPPAQWWRLGPGDPPTAAQRRGVAPEGSLVTARALVHD